MKWNIDSIVKKLPEIKNPILIEGLPGIGNVGKITVDFIVEEKKAKKIFEFTSNSLPHSVFVNEKNLIELPKIEMYYLKNNKNDILLLVGDVQPIEEESSYEFCSLVLDLLEKNKGKEIITLGGIGLSQIPKTPKLFCTGDNEELIKRYLRGTNLDNKLYGVVGPIIGATGLLLGLSKKRNIPSICILAETYGHPMFLGISGAKEILKVLDKKLNLKINIEKLEKEVTEIENEMNKTQDISMMTFDNVKERFKKYKKSLDYIG